MNHIKFIKHKDQKTKIINQNQQEKGFLNTLWNLGGFKGLEKSIEKFGPRKTIQKHVPLTVHFYYCYSFQYEFSF